MGDEWIELGRFRGDDGLEDISSILEKIDVATRLASTTPVFDYSSLGVAKDPEVIISVPLADFARARSALEAEFATYPLPEDHWLRDTADDELLDVLANPSDWSAFDIAHAQAIARRKNLSVPTPDSIDETRIDELRRGRPAPAAMMWLALICALSGGFLGILLAWSTLTSKETTPNGVFFTYNEESRRQAKALLILGVIVFLGSLVIWLVSGPTSP